MAINVAMHIAASLEGFIALTPTVPSIACLQRSG